MSPGTGAQAADADVVLDRLAAAAAMSFTPAAAAVWLLNAAGDSLTFATGHGLPAGWPPCPVVSLTGSRAAALMAGFAAVEDAAAGPEAADLPPGLSATLAVSLEADDLVLGTLCIYSAQPRHFTPAEVEALRALASLGAASLVAARKAEVLARAEADRARLMGVTAHELRSPITVAQSLVRSVLRGYAGPLTDLQRDVFARISGQLDFLSNLVNDFLHLTASRAPVSIAREGAVTLNESLARVVLALQPRAEEKGVSLTLHPPREELAVWATEEGLDHIFTNLVDNAVKYTPEGGTVTVAASRAGDQAQVIVADTGIGIPPEALPHLFEEFYRAPNARAMKAVGTGLGLAIVKGLVERYRGQIAVESTVGQGTTFTVTLPLHNAV